MLIHDDSWIITNFVTIHVFPETRIIRLSDGEEIMTLGFFVFIQYRTDGHAIPALA